MTQQDKRPQAQPALQELDAASLDLVVGGAVMHEIVAGGEFDARKQEQSEKLKTEEREKQ